MLTNDNGKYLLRGIGSHFTIKRLCGNYNIYHNEDGFIVQARTQRECRNAMRAYTTNKTITTEGRE